MSYAAARLGGESISVGAGSLIPALHGSRAVVDQILQLDALSPQGVRIALGAGWDRNEFERYGKPFTDRFRSMYACVDLLRGHEGFDSSKQLLQTISSDSRQWVTAGMSGVGVYTGAFGRSMDMLERHTLDYRRALLNSPVRVDGGWVACMTHCYVGSDDRSAGEEYESTISSYMDRHALRSRLGVEERRRTVDSGLARMRESMGLIGSPETITSRFRGYERAGIDEIVLLFQYSDDLTRELDQLSKIQKVLYDECV